LAGLVEDRGVAGKVSADRDVENDRLRPKELARIAARLRIKSARRSPPTRIRASTIHIPRNTRTREEPNPNPHIIPKRRVHSSPGAREPGTIRSSGVILDETAFVPVRLVETVRSDECAAF